MSAVGGSHSAAIEFFVLGPVEVVRDGSTLSLGGPRQRALLALLLLEPGRPIATDRLEDELWHGAPPRGAATTLRAYVSKLRGVLGDDAPIASTESGYAIDVQPDRIDASRFERLTKEGQAALARGAVVRAAERFQAALLLWRGNPFAGLSDDGALRLEAERLAELRLLAVEGRIEAELVLGQDAQLVDELEALVREHPYRERLWRQLMLSLYRADRQADALAAYRRGRALLDELGLEPSAELKALEQSILRQDVPPAARPEQRHNLPAAVTSFVGRERELGELEHLLARNRLVTLTGVGGTGKTRLALEAAERALPDFPDGVFFADLAPLADPSLVAQHVVAALDVVVASDVPVEKLLADHLRQRELLLVLDNCEHLRGASAELTRSLLATCARLRVVATSRELLGVPGEVDYPVPPLGLPAPDADADELRASEAVRLFLARAREASPRIGESAALESVGEICRELDGLPFAIELAAARAKALTPEEIAARLADRFRFLVSWRRLTAARHRTLREAMDWSYELLSEAEQALLAQLAVFAGGFTLDAVAKVCVDGNGERALELVGRLIDASLVVADEDDGATRYGLLETVRQYAAERLDERGETEAARRRHATWCLALVEEAESRLTGEDQTRWLAILDAERDNLRAALSYLGTAGDHERRLRLTIALSRFWYIRGHLAEGRRRLEQALEGSEGGDPALRRRALTAAASLALLQGDYLVATRHAEQALDVARAVAEPLFVANALSNLGAIVLAAGDHGRAAGLLEEAVELARAGGDQRIAALAINNLGDLALTIGDYERAEPLFEESLALLRARGDTANVARSLFNLGAVALRLGRLEDADARLRESLAFAEEAGDKEDLAWCLEGFAGRAAAEGRGERAALLLGAAGALLEEIGAEYKPFERQLHEATRSESLRLCGEQAFADALRRGAALPLAEVVAAELEGSPV
jgi:predicted ATPase/DNA-binding SARP family transcriptional activator